MPRYTPAQARALAPLAAFAADLADRPPAESLTARKARARKADRVRKLAAVKAAAARRTHGKAGPGSKAGVGSAGTERRDSVRAAGTGGEGRAA